MIIDSHFHSQEMVKKKLSPVTILQELRTEGLGAVLDIATHISDWDTRWQMLKHLPFVFFSLGLYPSTAEDPHWRDLVEKLDVLLGKKLCDEHRIVALGEIGLDFHWNYATQYAQIELLEHQLNLAKKHELPVVIHNRNADHQMIEVLQKASLSHGGVMHCYSSESKWVKPFLDLGMYISFAGNVTFKKNTHLREACKLVPDTRLLLETDSPYLAPEPKRGKINNPGFIKYTYQAVSDIRNIDQGELEEVIQTNFQTLFPASSAIPSTPSSLL